MMSQLPPVAKLTEKAFLVIEDDASDAALIRRAFASLSSCRAFVCRNMSEAKAYVQGAGMYQNRGEYPVPAAIICDLRLGKDSGLDFLTWLKDATDFKNLPIVILSGSLTEEETAVARERGALDVLEKPAQFEKLKEILANVTARLEV